MPDLLVGAPVRAADWPAAAYEQEATSQSNITATSAARSIGSPGVGFTFFAPTSGRVTCVIGGGFRDNAGNDRVFVAPRIHQGLDADGRVVVDFDVTRYGLISALPAARYSYWNRRTLIEGLEPGAQHFARYWFWTDGGSGSADIFVRELLIAPAS